MGYNSLDSRSNILNKTLFITALLSVLAWGLLACELTPESLSASLTDTAADVTTVRVTGAVVNLRAGPSVQYKVLGQVEAGDRLPVTGISPNRTWLQVQVEAERRWIFADLTDVSAELRGTLAEVAAPGLEGSVSASAGQSTSAAAELVAPEPTPATGLQRVEFWAPGTYADAPGLDYDFEIAWVDRSVEWDWTLKNQDGGCYDALRAFMGPLPAQHGIRKYEIALTDVGDTLNMDYYLESPTLLIGYQAEPRANLGPLIPSWPQWEGKLPAGSAAGASLCHSTQLDSGVVPCEVQLWWGEPGDYLDGAAVQTLAGVMGGVTLLPQSIPASIDWMQQSVRDSRRYLAPFRSGRPQGPNVCFHIQRAR